MPPKRLGPRSAPSSPAPSPLLNAFLLAAAVVYGLWQLVTRGRLSWPPHDLLADAFTLAGCLALVGPIVVARREADGGGLGELTWMAGGLLIWIFDLAAAVRGEARGVSWATPLGPRTMGLTVLAVLLAGWRTRAGARSWSWTNVVGWLLGLFWVGMALASLIPGGPPRPSPR